MNHFTCLLILVCVFLTGCPDPDATDQQQKKRQAFNLKWRQKE